MSELDELAYKYGTDKATCRPSWAAEDEGHGYSLIYEKYLEKYKNDPLEILEIGMGNVPHHGCSMRMWLDYLPNAKLSIADINPANFKCDFEYDEDRVSFHVLNQGNDEDLKKFVAENNKYNIIIDDGSHDPSHQKKTFENFFPELLDEGGIYFVEDIYQSYFPKRFNGNRLPGGFPDFIFGQVDKIQANMMLGGAGQQFNGTSYIDNDINIESLHIYKNFIVVKKI